VEVTGRRDGRNIVVEVCDEGIGIAPKHQERIFQVFERLHTTEAYPGTGIGLAIVKRGISRIGGKVWVESTPGKGSRFYISLPSAS
jgi:signal transduction histidine kinase